MLAPLTYATALAYLLRLGERFQPIGRAELTYDGQAGGKQQYPLVLVEGDGGANELIGEAGRPAGLDTFTLAVQVLQKAPDATPEALRATLVQTNGWADQLTEQLRRECSGQLASVNKLAMPGQAGGDLATGWRLELTLKLTKDLNRTTNATFFDPA